MNSKTITNSLSNQIYYSKPHAGRFRLFVILVCVSLILLSSGCAPINMVVPTIRENDDRSEHQIRLDSAISQKINRLFIKSEIVKNTDLRISTYKHVVTVNGFVGTKKQKLTALRLALSVSGVKSVVSDIGIRN